MTTDLKTSCSFTQFNIVYNKESDNLLIPNGSTLTVPRNLVVFIAKSNKFWDYYI